LDKSIQILILIALLSNKRRNILNIHFNSSNWFAKVVFHAFVLFHVDGVGVDFIQIEIEFKSIIKSKLELPPPLASFLHQCFRLFLILDNLACFHDFSVGIIFTTIVAQYGGFLEMSELLPIVIIECECLLQLFHFNLVRHLFFFLLLLAYVAHSFVPCGDVRLAHMRSVVFLDWALRIEHT